MTEKNDSKKEIEQLRDAEKKFQSYIQKRNEFNDMAKVLREERDMIHDSRKEIKGKIDELKKERDENVEKMRAHKKMRNKLQEEAKKLIEAKQKKRGSVFKNLPMRVEELKADVQMLEYKQETVPMSPQEENGLIEKIRDKREEFKRTKKQLAAQKELSLIHI